jgi:hypothetical protein
MGIERAGLPVMRLAMACAALAVAAMATTSSAALPPDLPLRVFARTGIRLTGIAWTGKQFLYVENTTNRVLSADPTGMPLKPFATMPRQVEETRCRPSPGAHGFAAGDIFCHSPDNKIYRLSADGKRVTTFAVLPSSARSDGALTFDTVGRFDYALLAATGRSGNASARGGIVFAVDATGAVHRVGAYRAAGGADEIAVAPSRFGAASGQVLLAVDAGHGGSVVAMDPRGQSRTLVSLPDGPNPIVALTPGEMPRAGAAQAGLYITDTLSRNVFFASAAALKPYAGAVLVGSELRGLLWVLRPAGSGFAATRLATALGGKHYNFEDAIYLAG